MHDAQHSIGGKARQQRDGCAGAKTGIHEHGLAEGVEERQHHQADVVLVHLDHVARGYRVHDHVAVGQLSALGAARGPGGVKDHCRLVGLRLHRVEDRRLAGHDAAQRRHALAFHRRSRGWISRGHDEVAAVGSLLKPLQRHLRHGQFRRALEDDQRDRITVFEVIGDLASFEQHVERHHSRAQLQNGVVGDGKVRDVEARQRDLVAALHAKLAQPVGQLVSCAVDLGIIELGVVEDHGRLSRVGLSAGLQQHR